MDHYDDTGAKHKDVPLATKATTEPPKTAGVPPELAGKQSAAQTGYIGDLYDGEKSFKLETGAKKHDYSGYTPDHYDSVKPKKAKGGKAKKGEKKAETKKPAAKGGVPTELQGTKAAAA